MRFSTVSKKDDSSVSSSISLFVALYLILLAFFIILTKDLSFDEYKQTVAMHSLLKTFGHPKTQEIYFGVIEEGKIDEFPAAMKEIFRDNIEIIIPADNSHITLKFDKDYLYYPDEAKFKQEAFEKIIEFRDILRSWKERDNPKFTVRMSFSDYKTDKERLAYFRNRFGDISFFIGLDYNQDNSVEIVIDTSETGQ